MASTSKTMQVSTGGDWVLLRMPDAERELIKTEFNEKIHAHFLSTRSLKECSQMSNLWSHDCLDPLILRIQKEKEKTGHDGMFVYNHEDKFLMVGVVKGKERLLLQDEYGQFKVVLPWEDTFDIFWESHLKYCHPSTRTLKHILQDKYVVNDFAIEKISEVCYACSGKQKPYVRCALDILHHPHASDYAFTQIMIYQDLYTGYIHIRPLCADSMESDICLELLKIFMDFGPPKEVLISSEIFLVALDQIKHLTTFAPFTITVLEVREDQTKFQHIKNALAEWMKENEFENWSIACYGVQSYLNNQSKPGHKPAYDKIFKNIEMCEVEDLNEVELDSLASSSDTNIDEGVFTTFSPSDFNAKSNVSGIKIPEKPTPNPFAPGDEPLITDTFMPGSATSDDESMQANDVDPLALDWAIENVDV